MIECNRGCKQKYMKKNETKHLQEDCVKNEYRCDFCKQGIAKALEAQHLGTCPKFVLPCPHNCGVKEILRENMQTHLDNECPNHEISCPFVDSNCEFKSLRPAMAKHLKESPGIHLNLMCKTISSQKKAMILLGEVVDQQKELLMSLNSKLNNMERFYGSQLIWKIDNFAVNSPLKLYFNIFVHLEAEIGLF
jgi:TNF receptor-associated factor 4